MRYLHSFFFCIIALALGASCSPSPQEEIKPAKVTSLQIVASPELRPLLKELGSAFEAANITLGDGSILRLGITEVPEVQAAQRIADGSLRTDGWIVSPTELIEFVNHTKRGLGPEQIECTPLFGSSLVLGLRKYDQELYLQDNTVSPLETLADQPKTPGLQWFPHLSLPLPDESGIGLGALLAIIEMALRDAPSPTTLAEAKALPRLSDYLDLITLLDIFPAQQRLSYLPKRSGIIPGIIGSAQQVNTALPRDGSALTAIDLDSSKRWITYSLCTSDAPWVTLPKRVGLRILSKTFSSPTGTDLIKKFGFDSVPTSLPTPKLSHDFVTLILQSWRTIFPSTSLIYVIDATERTPPELLERMKLQVSRALELRTTLAQTAVVTVGETANVLIPPKTPSTEGTRRVSSIPRVGTTTIHAGIKLALELLKSDVIKTSHNGVIILSSSSEAPGSLVPTILDEQLSGEPPTHIAVVHLLPNTNTDTLTLQQSGMVSYFFVPSDLMESVLDKVRKMW